MNNKVKIKPFVKWVGGKKQLIPIISEMLPKKYNDYYEPFIGGGALFFHIKPLKAIINDINSNLIQTYQDIANNLTNLIQDLNILQKLHTLSSDKSIFHKEVINSEYPNIVVKTTSNSEERERERETIYKINKCLSSAKFIYLNKTSFNGMYRVNSKGKFNTPYNHKDDLQLSTLYDLDNLNEISNYLKNAQIKILNEDFEQVINMTQKEDFIFVDPPYDSDTATFNSYDKEGFDKEKQRELAQVLNKASQRGVKWILTNHNTVLINELYKNYNKKLVSVNRQINSDSQNRINSTQELIIYNYDLDEKQDNASNVQVFLKQLKNTSSILKEYVSWDKIDKNIQEIKLSCNSLNFLLTSKDEKGFYANFELLFEKQKEVFKILPILISKRLDPKEEFIFIDQNEEENNFDFEKKEKVKSFISESGLLTNIFLNSNVKDIYSYVFGIEVGMNTSNSQKNKTGIYMERKIKQLLKTYNIDFEEQVNYNIISKNIEENKRFDFSFKKENITYYLECNFFNVSGSKVNSETQRFIKLNKEINQKENIKFIWITDGQGWKKQTHQLSESINEIKHFYNLITFEKFIKNL